MSLSEKSLDSKSWGNTKKPYNVFYIWYTELCRRMNMTPLTTIKPAKLKNDHVLDFIVDRIKLDEWNPILRALRQDSSIHVLAVRSRVIKAGNKFLPEVDTREKVRTMKKRCSLILTPYMLKFLIKSLATCIQNSTVLTSLELDGLPIYGEYFESINESLIMNRRIRMLSLIHSPIGDRGCEILAKNLRALPNIEIINLTSCDLGPQSAQQLARVIKFQQINRYCESWHCSLRYEDPDIGKMTGLRRITLNSNPRIGDEGLIYILNELDDDLWIKALDMQRCNITENVAKKIIDVVEYSKSLEVADFRYNNLAPASVERILQLLNSKTNSTPEFTWCYTTTTLACNDSVYDVRSSVSSNVQKSKSAPLRQPSLIKTTEHDRIPLKRSKTFSLLSKRSNTRVPAEPQYPLVGELGQAKKEILNLGNKLKLEMSKRRQIEQENIILKKQLLAVHKPKEDVGTKGKKMQLKVNVPYSNKTNNIHEKRMSAPLVAKPAVPLQKSQVTFVFPPKKNVEKPADTKVQQIFMNLLQTQKLQANDNKNADKVNNNEYLQRMMKEIQGIGDNYVDDDEDLRLLLKSIDDCDDFAVADLLKCSTEAEREKEIADGDKDEHNEKDFVSYIHQYIY